MFLKTNASQTGYTRHGQKASGPFLILFSGMEKYQSAERMLPVIKAAVRTVKLSQCGHFMMGSTQLGPHRIVLSGAYGEDGLTCDPDKYPGLWEKLYPLPNELADEFWKGGGHNSPGTEAPSLRKWALANYTQLRKAGK